MLEIFADKNFRLENDCIALRLMQESHLPELVELAMNKRIWEFYAYDMTSPEQIRNKFEIALEEFKKGNQIPFVIYHQKQHKLVGSTRFLAIETQHKKLEIGWTWLHPDYWGTNVNAHCKLLLLQLCFEQLKLHRVQLKTDANNLRSRSAILKLGAQFEGILRNDMIRENGSNRNSAYYSILPDEWNSCKQQLLNYIKIKTL